MSYILYSSIARAGGIDLYMGSEAVSHPPEHPYRRRSGPNRLDQLRRAAGRGLVSLGQTMTRWGRSWAAGSGATPAVVR